MNDRRIRYHEIFKNPPDDLAKAIIRTVPKIDMAEIYVIVDSTPHISDTRKEYLKQALDMRYRQILAPALKHALNERGITADVEPDCRQNEDEEDLER